VLGEQQHPADEHDERRQGHANLQEPADELFDRVIGEASFAWIRHTAPVMPL
jgi:hypothetical protein